MESLFKAVIRRIKEKYGDRVKIFFDDDHMIVMVYAKDRETYRGIKNIVRVFWGGS